jgi:hypothetical protein
MTTILKISPKARRTNNLRKEPIPVEMLPKMNRMCGKWGHKWEYTPNGMKICTQHLCEVREPYTPNEHAMKGRFGG